MPEVLIRRDGAVGTIVLSNPPKFNAMSFDMWRGLPTALADFERLDSGPGSVSVWVVSGRGDSKIWEADAAGRETEARRAACELSACVAAMLGVDAARLCLGPFAGRNE